MKLQKRLILMALCLLFIYVFAACSGEIQTDIKTTPTAGVTATVVPGDGENDTVSATKTPAPTATPAPTEMPEPTATSAPTATPKPTATSAPTAPPGGFRVDGSCL